MHVRGGMFIVLIWVLGGQVLWAQDLTKAEANKSGQLFHPPKRLKSVDGIIDIGDSWGHASPWVEDVDGDGVKDLIVGGFHGKFEFFRNLGTNNKPRYAKGQYLKAGGVVAQVRIY